MYFSTYLPCFDINFEIPRNTNKGGGKAISYGSLVNFWPFLYIIVYFLGEGDNL